MTENQIENRLRIAKKQSKNKNLPGGYYYEEFYDSG